jgi:queuine tRNA-ribosyltransferase
MKFNIKNTSDFARKQNCNSTEVNIQTPAFMPVGTNGTVKGLTVEDLNLPVQRLFR